MYQVKKTADNIDEAAKELPDANLVRPKKLILYNMKLSMTKNF